MRTVLAALLIGAAIPAAPAAAQTATVTQAIAGTRLDLNVTGEVTRVPDLATISAGVVSRASTATAALQDIQTTAANAKDAAAAPAENFNIGLVAAYP